MAEADLDYTFDSSVTDTDTTKDVDQANISILVKHLKEIDKLIAKHNTFDVISADPKLPPMDMQIIAHKLLVSYLRMFRDDVAEKIKELNNGR